MHRRVAIIGGGAASAALLGELLARQTPQTLHLDWYTGGGTPARGVAYSTTSDRHLLNVRAASMGMFAGKPQGFLDFVQLHGKETPARAHQVAERTGAGVIKVFSVSEASDLEPAAAYEQVADHLMFDAKAPQGFDRPGGTGARFDWDILAGRRFAKPWFLAGGLDPWCVAEAVQRAGAPLVDVSSGVERGPGLKDPALIRAFLDAARSGRSS